MKDLYHLFKVVYQKSKDTIQFHLILWMELIYLHNIFHFFLSKLTTIYKMVLAFAISFDSYCLPLIQQLNRFDGCCGIVHFMLVMLRNSFQI